MKKKQGAHQTINAKGPQLAAPPNTHMYKYTHTRTRTQKSVLAMCL